MFKVVSICVKAFIVDLVESSIEKRTERFLLFLFFFCLRLSIFYIVLTFQTENSSLNEEKKNSFYTSHDRLANTLKMRIKQRKLNEFLVQKENRWIFRIEYKDDRLTLFSSFFERFFWASLKIIFSADGIQENTSNHLIDFCLTKWKGENGDSRLRSSNKRRSFSTLFSIWVKSLKFG